MVRWLFVILALLSGCESVNRQRLVDLANKYEAEIREQKSDAGLDVLLAKLSDGKTWRYNKLDTLAVVKSSDTQGDYDALASRMEQGIRMPQIWYDVKCKSCGSEFRSTAQGDLDHCLNCPFDICDETAQAIMMIGTLQEIVRAQPQNAQAKERFDEYLSIFNKHLEGCEKCRKAMEKHTGRKSSKSSVARSTPQRSSLSEMSDEQLVAMANQEPKEAIGMNAYYAEKAKRTDIEAAKAELRRRNVSW